MTDLAPGFRIRQATAQDHPALSDICLKTGDSGADGTHLQDDPAVLGLVYALPYQVHCPDFAFVLEDAQGVCGYILGTPDSREFAEWLEAVWYPSLRARVPNPGPDEGRWVKSDWVRWRIHAPFALPPINLATWPAHCHIDLLPRAQGKGLGRAMMARLNAALASAGCGGTVVEVGLKNTRAQAFYAHLGFRLIDPPGLLPHSLFMGLRLPA